MSEVRSEVLADMIAYQENAVVSRTIVDKKIATVTIFAFDDGQGLSEHTAPFDTMVQVLDGVVEITVSGKARPVKAGELIIMPAHEPHSLQAMGQFKMLLTMIRA